MNPNGYQAVAIRCSNLVPSLVTFFNQRSKMVNYHSLSKLNFEIFESDDISRLENLYVSKVGVLYDITLGNLQLTKCSVCALLSASKENLFTSKLVKVIIDN